MPFPAELIFSSPYEINNNTTHFEIDFPTLLSNTPVGNSYSLSSQFSCKIVPLKGTFWKRHAWFNSTDPPCLSAFRYYYTCSD
jgi:hypothetical protein